MNTAKRALVRVLLVAVLLLITAPPTRAALGWVGNMWPAGGSQTDTTVPASFTVYIQVWKDGVTNSPGQGAGISCYLHWDALPFWGAPTWLNTTDTAMAPGHLDPVTRARADGRPTPDLRAPPARHPCL